MNANRIEHDLIGTKEIPKEAYYGIHSIRAKENFRISGRKVHREFIIGNDTTVTLASEAGQLELNAFAPIIFDRLFAPKIKCGEIFCSPHFDCLRLV